MTSTAPLPTALATAAAGHGSPADLLAALRGADQLLVALRDDTDPDTEPAVTLIPAGDREWLPVFSTVDELVEFAAHAGVQDEVHYTAMPGATLLDQVLTHHPQGRGVGLLLDPATIALSVPHELLNSTQPHEEPTA